MQLHFKNYTRLTEEEARVVLPQRNAPKCRKQMFNSHEISERDHFDFIRRLTQRKDCAYWAVVIDGEIQGGVYLQGSSSTWVTHLYHNMGYTSARNLYHNLAISSSVFIDFSKLVNLCFLLPLGLYDSLLCSFFLFRRKRLVLFIDHP